MYQIWNKNYSIYLLNTIDICCKQIKLKQFVKYPKGHRIKVITTSYRHIEDNERDAGAQVEYAYD